MPSSGSQALFCVRGRAIEGGDQFTGLRWINWSFVANSYFLLVVKLCAHIPFHMALQCLPVGKAACSCLPPLLWAWSWDLTNEMLTNVNYRGVKCAFLGWFACMSFHNHEKNIYEVAADPLRRNYMDSEGPDFNTAQAVLAEPSKTTTDPQTYE